MEPANTTIYVVKQANSRPVGSASTESLAYPGQNRVFISQTVSEITEAGLKQIEALKVAFKGIKFDTVIYTPQNRTELTITPVSDQQSERPIMVRMEDWDEVRMGDLNGKAVGEIKELYMKVFPEAEKPKTDNEAMNHPWGEEYDFEP